MKSYRATRARMGDNSWSVWIEVDNTERPDPDPWGNGPVIVYTVVKNVPRDLDYDTPGIARSYLTVNERPPRVTDGALRKAERVAARLNDPTDTLDEAALRRYA